MNDSDQTDKTGGAAQQGQAPGQEKPGVRSVPLGALQASPTQPGLQAPAHGKLDISKLDRWLDIPITLVFEVGRTQIRIRELMSLREGSYIDLRNVAVDSIDIRLDDKVIGACEAVSVQHRYGMRIGKIFPITGDELD